jgi:hypothetical protein
MPSARAYREVVPNDSVLFEEVLERSASRSSPRLSKRAKPRLGIRIAM